ncbi:MAG: branched-chain amino acid ABC transporter substrate-binding protein [Casimicrobiaceae bacterium]|nr:branched-chain amino acid ABC transporter substrate-binding protein [Casimicrobiaceae bacterium]MCX8099344.1 branched-chain amino acid ABC transporter substrate-binding protein [Casimicrobiaceae bacterium]MDW8311234.1 branched-chain amino acid ABC transporter substrate-binding protein [Burkholderiales bacterium]
MIRSKQFLLACLGIAVSVGLVACGKKEEPKKAEAAKPAAPQEVTVKIAHVGPTSGQIAHLGKDNENGARLAIEEANAKGITIDGKKIKFELVAEDDAADPKQATSVAQKVVDAKVIGVIGHLNSGTSIPASAIYNQAGIPMISPSATNPKLTAQGFKGVFRVVANDVAQGTAIGNFAVKNLGAKKVAIIDDKTAYGAGLADETEKAVKAAGGEVVIRESLANEKEQDFKGVLTKVKAKNPDVIMFGGMDAQAGPMLKQIKALGIKAKFISGDGAQTGELIKLAGDAAEGAYATTAGLPKEKMPQGQAFYDKYKAKFNTDVQVYAPFTYDATNVLIAAMQQANSLEPAKIIDALKTISYQGVTGPIAFDEKGDIKDGAITVFQVKGGKWETVEVIGGPKPAAAPAAPAAPAAAPAEKKDEKKDEKKK